MQDFFNIFKSQNSENIKEQLTNSYINILHL